ncbi:DinB family protein [Sinorhizobium sp. BG8]|uniref:DinB family protein n=1 Tax=Sinorhizobium sp. BG8 TaxID=2613773 RepID=UPI00193E15DD|nr:DinB family protein [Sinorhizobium sp. BG8]QRM54896.1 damage-inducible protein DinB [Sinorhizobium sp. BG8]
MIRHFQMFAAYNAWANRNLYEAVSKVTDEEFRRDTGAFFKSLQGTLNHILVADRIWLKRLTGQGEAPPSLDTVLFDDFAGLHAARVAEDARIIDWLTSLSEEDLKRDMTYSPVSSPIAFTHAVEPTLVHVFNHQTHHRGQAHSGLTALGKPSISLDLIYFLRSEGQEWMTVQENPR